MSQQKIKKHAAIHASYGGVVIGGDNHDFVNIGTIAHNKVIVNGKKYQCNLYIPFVSKLVAPSPTQLLHWSSRLPSKLIAWDAKFQSLLNWANSEANLSFAVLEGIAGAGKTRLAFELADHLRNQSWQAGQVKNCAEAIAFSFSQQGVLLILDYPEEHPHKIANFFAGLKNMASPVVDGQALKLRVLLLCCDYASLQDHHGFLALKGNEGLCPMHLGILQQQDLWNLFHQTKQAFSPYRKMPALAAELTQVAFEHWLAQDEGHRSPLLVQTLALSQFDAPGQTKPQDELIEDLLLREKNHFNQRCKALNWSSQLQKGAWLVQVMAAMAGELSFEELGHLQQVVSSQKIGGLELPTRTQWCALLGDGAMALRGIEPELFASHAMYNSKILANASLYATECLPHLYQNPEGSGRSLEYPALLCERLRRLARLNWDRPIATQNKVDPWISTLENHLANEAADTAWFQFFSSDYPLPSNLNYSAICWFRSAVEIYEPLCQDNFNTIAPYLVACLNNLAKHLFDNGESVKALEASRRALEVLKLLTVANFAYTPALVRNLNTLFVCLTAYGEHIHALEVIRRTVEILEPLAEKNFDTYAPDLGTSLHNLSVSLSQNKQPVEALKVINRAMKINEQLYRDNPSAHAPDLARNLSTLSTLLLDNRKRVLALKASRRSVEIYEQLYQENFVDCAPDLARSLNNLSQCLSKNQEILEALKVIYRAVEIYEQLYQTNSDYASELANSLHNLSTLLPNNGDIIQAFLVSERACKLSTQFSRSCTTHADRKAEMFRWRDDLRNKVLY